MHGVSRYSVSSCQYRHDHSQLPHCPLLPPPHCPLQLLLPHQGGGGQRRPRRDLQPLQWSSLLPANLHVSHSGIYFVNDLCVDDLLISLSFAETSAPTPGMATPMRGSCTASGRMVFSDWSIL